MRKLDEQYIINNKGQRKAIILPINKYNELLEDIHDLTIIAERRDEPTISFEELKKQLKKDELL